MAEQSEHARLARMAVEVYVNERRSIDMPKETSDELCQTRAGAFVCIKQGGQLRGCIGTIEPVQECLAREIIANAISSATQDPRFLPVESWELDGLDYTVDVLAPAEPVSDLSELDVKRYGVIVESGERRGLLLPDLDGVETVEQQVEIARHKALIPEHVPVKLYRFEVIRHQ